MTEFLVEQNRTKSIGRLGRNWDQKALQILEEIKITEMYYVIAKLLLLQVQLSALWS